MIHLVRLLSLIALLMAADGSLLTSSLMADHTPVEENPSDGDVMAELDSEEDYGFDETDPGDQGVKGCYATGC